MDYHRVAISPPLYCPCSSTKITICSLSYYAIRSYEAGKKHALRVPESRSHCCQLADKRHVKPRWPSRDGKKGPRFGVSCLDIIALLFNAIAQGHFETQLKSIEQRQMRDLPRERPCMILRCSPHLQIQRLQKKQRQKRMEDDRSRRQVDLASIRVDVYVVHKEKCGGIDKCEG